MQTPLGGIYAASVTPLDDDGLPALHILSRHLRYLEANGCDGALILGTTGEGPSFSVEERQAVLWAAAAERGSLKLLAGTGATSLSDAITLTRTAFEAGYDGALVVPPFYFKDATLAGLFAFYGQLLQQAVPGDGRLMLYHIPQVSGVAIEPQLIHLLRDEFGERVAGIKDSQGDREHTLMLCQEFPGFHVFTGSDVLLADTLAAGGAGAITALANVFPTLLHDVQEAHVYDLPIEPPQKRLSEKRQLLTGLGLGTAVAIKAMLHLDHRLPNDVVRLPLLQATEQERATLVERFELQTSENV